MTDQNKITITDDTQDSTHSSGVEAMQNAIKKQAQQELKAPVAPVLNNITQPQKITSTSQSIPEKQYPQFPHTTQINTLTNPNPNAPKLGNAYMRTFRQDSAKISGISTMSAQRPIKQAAPKTLNVMPTLKEQPKKDHTESMLHTYRQDVQGMVKNKKMSLMRMAALESKQDNAPMIQRQSNKTHVSKTLIVILLFIIIGVIAMSGAFYTYVAREAITAPIYKTYSLIFTEGTEYVNIAKKRPRALKRLLTEIRKNSFYSLGSVVNIALTKEHTDIETGQVITEPVDAKEFLLALSDELPESFAGLFVDKFMLGLHVTNENKPFLILRTKSYDEAFAGMLTWETRIEQDLHPLFSPINAQDVITSSNNTAMFKDVVMKNVVTRVLRDNNNNIRILYAFIDTHTLIITTNINTLIELKNRLRIAK